MFFVAAASAQSQVGDADASQEDASQKDASAQAQVADADASREDASPEGASADAAQVGSADASVQRLVPRPPYEVPVLEHMLKFHPLEKCIEIYKAVRQKLADEAAARRQAQGAPAMEDASEGVVAREVSSEDASTDASEDVVAQAATPTQSSSPSSTLSDVSSLVEQTASEAGADASSDADVSSPAGVEGPSNIDGILPLAGQGKSWDFNSEGQPVLVQDPMAVDAISNMDALKRAYSRRMKSEAEADRAAGRKRRKKFCGVDGCEFCAITRRELFEELIAEVRK